MRNNKKRFIYMLGIGLLISSIFLGFIIRRPPHGYLQPTFFILIATFIIIEGNLRIDSLLNKKISWFENPKRRIFFQFGLASIFTISSVILCLRIAHYFIDKDGKSPHGIFNDPILIPGILVTIIVLLVDIGIQFYKSLQVSLLETEKHKAESAIAQLQNLKNQINPHFLFNNLSILSALVYKGDRKAVEFINEFSQVYRYALANDKIELVSLEEELSFLNHYIYLLSIRFEKGIDFNFAIDNKKKDFFILPMCLQMLVENVIQHNEISIQKPLTVAIYTTDNSLVIENKIQLRRQKEESSQIGLENIKRRFSHFCDEEVIVLNDGNYFKVILPLISKR